MKQCPAQSNSNSFSPLSSREMRFECYQLCMNSASHGKHKAAEFGFSPRISTPIPCVGESLYNITNHPSIGGGSWMHDTLPDDQVFDSGV